jgi:DNA polymerase-1
MRLVFDIETDGLEATKVHCIVAKDITTKKVYTFRPDQIEEGIKFLNDAEMLIGHNIMAYDCPTLQRLYPEVYNVNGKIRDTLVYSRLIWPDRKDRDFTLFRQNRLPGNLIGSHGLKAWGYRLGFYKGSFHENADWSEFSEEMLEYCKQDVELNTRLLHVIIKQKYPLDAVDLEHDIHSICLRQQWAGFPFDDAEGMKLYGKLSKRRTEIQEELVSTFGSWWESQGEVTPKRTVNYKDRPGTVEGAPYTKIIRITFNPASRHHIAKCLIEKYGWKPKELTETKEPKVDEKVLSGLKYPEARLLSEYLMIQKRIGQLAEGKQAWLKLSKEGRIHGQVTTMGAVTSRCTHQNPNLAQVPSVKAEYGNECRSLFYAPKGYKMLGCDVSGLELRCLAEAMSEFDGGAYGKELLNGDIHTANQMAAGLPTRDNAKTFIYGFLYGAGDEKIGSIIGKGKKEGARLKKAFLAKTPALKKLRDKVKNQVESQGYLEGIDKRRMPIRSAHSAVNTLLQGMGAILCKRWVVIFHKLCEEQGLVHGEDYTQVAYVHDELQILVKEEIAEKLGELCVDAIRQAGEYYNLSLPLDGEFKIGNNWAETH